jgi:hypothetical protein
VEEGGHKYRKGGRVGDKEGWIYKVRGREG